jgi:ribosomal protein L34E
MKKQVKCTNIGVCTRAGKVFVIDDDEQQGMACPECGETLEKVEETRPPEDKEKDKKKKKKRVLFIVLCGVVVAIGAIIGSLLWSSKDSPETNWPERIVLAETNLTMKVGDTMVIRPEAVPFDEKKEATFIFESSNPECVQVTSDGMVIAKNEGTITVTVTCEQNPSVSATCVVMVEKEVEEPDTTIIIKEPDPVLLSEINVIEREITLDVGEKKPLRYSTTPEKHDEKIVFKSSNEEVAVITSFDEVLAQRAGKAIITLTANQSGTQAQMEVTVRDNQSRNRNNGGSGGGRQTFVRNINLGYGTYTGEVKPGTRIPHGHGTVVYKSSHAIAGSYSANPGDKYEGEFRDGRPSGGIGYWTHNGNVTTINP